MAFELNTRGNVV